MQHSLWNMYTRIRNGIVAKKKSILHPKKLYILEVLKIFYREGYISSFKLSKEKSDVIEIFLKYSNGKPVLSNLQPVSKPGRRIYLSKKTLWKLNTSSSTLILSTPFGILSDKDCRKRKIGGEILCVLS